MDATASDYLFQLVAKAYERRSLIVTSNLEFQEWGSMAVDSSFLPGCFQSGFASPGHDWCARQDSNPRPWA